MEYNVKELYGKTVFADANAMIYGRGRNHPFGWSPAQIPASAANALGSYLGCLASKRTFG